MIGSRPPWLLIASVVKLVPDTEEFHVAVVWFCPAVFLHGVTAWRRKGVDSSRIGLEMEGGGDIIMIDNRT